MYLFNIVSNNPGQINEFNLAQGERFCFPFLYFANYVSGIYQTNDHIHTYILGDNSV